MTTIALLSPRMFGRRTHRAERARARALEGYVRIARLRRLTIACSVAFVVITVSSLALANGNATAGYELRTRERQAERLREEVRRLDLLTLDAQAPERIADRLRGEQFIPVAHVEYLMPTDHVVAQR